MVGAVIAIGFFAWLGWKVGVVLLSFLLRGLAAIMLLTAVLTTVGHGPPISGDFLGGIIGFWLAGHLLFRLRFGHWNNSALAHLAENWQAGGVAEAERTHVDSPIVGELRRLFSRRQGA